MKAKDIVLENLRYVGEPEPMSNAAENNMIDVSVKLGHLSSSVRIESP